jgi:hypothetical protein
MAKRFQTYFGVAVPPWKEKKIGAGATTIRFVLTGNIISKKNNQQAVAIRKPARLFLRSCDKGGMVSMAQAMKAVSMVYAKMRGNTEYAKFLEKMKPVIQAQMLEWSNRLKSKGLIFPLEKSAFNLRLYIKDQYRRDTVNAQQTIQDLLKDCGVIVDDNDQVINPYAAASARYYEELIHNIAFISLTFKLVK